jgi:hypothetical protein
LEDGIGFFAYDSQSFDTAGEVFIRDDVAEEVRLARSFDVFQIPVGREIKGKVLKISVTCYPRHDVWDGKEGYEISSRDVGNNFSPYLC